jgi:hypothetical protein
MRDIDKSDLRRRILEDGSEDYTGLYEIIWSLNTHYPDVPRETKMTAARGVMLDLLQSGEIALYKTRWASNEYVAVPPSEALTVAQSAEAWGDPKDDPYVCYATP